MKRPASTPCGMSGMWPWSPLRSPHWRWYLANAIAAGDPAACAIPVHDAAVLNAVDVLRSSDKPTNDVSSCVVAIREANAIFQHDGWGRIVLESRLLTGETSEAVASQTGLSDEVVRAFHDVFFDVWSRLCHRSYITRFAIDVPAACDVTPGIDTAMKAFAYLGGPYVMDHLVAAHRSDLRGCGVQDRGLSLELDSSQAKAIREAVRVWRTPVTPDNTANWLTILTDQIAAQVYGGRRRTRRNVSAALRRRLSQDATNRQAKSTGECDRRESKSLDDQSIKKWATELS
jgi:hypothetical protein